MHMMWPNYFSGRHILRLFAVQSAHITIDTDGRFVATCDDGARAAESNTSRWKTSFEERAEGSGSVETIFLTDQQKIVNCVFLGFELIATMDVEFDVVNEAKAASACDKLAPYLALEAASVQAAKESHFSPGSKAEKVGSLLRERAKTNCFQFYSNLGLGTDAGAPPQPAKSTPLAREA